MTIPPGFYFIGTAVLDIRHNNAWSMNLKVRCHMTKLCYDHVGQPCIANEIK